MGKTSGSKRSLKQLEQNLKIESGEQERKLAAKNAEGTKVLDGGYGLSKEAECKSRKCQSPYNTPEDNKGGNRQAVSP